MQSGFQCRREVKLIIIIKIGPERYGTLTSGSQQLDLFYCSRGFNINEGNEIAHRLNDGACPESAINSCAD